MIYRPGNTVPVSGIYNVVDMVGRYVGRQITSEGGETFPATRAGTNEFGFSLHQQTVHARRY